MDLPGRHVDFRTFFTPLVSAGSPKHRFWIRFSFRAAKRPIVQYFLNNNYCCSNRDQLYDRNVPCTGTASTLPALLAEARPTVVEVVYQNDASITFNPAQDNPDIGITDSSSQIPDPSADPITPTTTTTTTTTTIEDMIRYRA